MTAKEVLKKLRSMADPKVLVEEQRLGIRIDNALGISVWDLRKFAKELGRDQALAEALWSTEIREARLLAGYLADPAKISEKTIDKWVVGFDSWDQVDQISDAFLFSPFAYAKAVEWSKRKEEFVKRTAFVLMAGLAFYDKEANDAKMEKFLPIIVREAGDDRNFVKKAVNWALRNIGKRNAALNKKAIVVAKKLATGDSKSAQWIGKDALKELTSDKIKQKLKRVGAGSPRPKLKQVKR